MILARRSFLRGAVASLVLAPAVVRASSIMPVSAPRWPADVVMTPARVKAMFKGEPLGIIVERDPINQNQVNIFFPDPAERIMRQLEIFWRHYQGDECRKAKTA